MSKHRQQPQHPNTQQALARAQETAAARAQFPQQAEGAEPIREAITPPAPVAPALAVVPPPAPKVTVTDRGIEYENPLVSLGVWLHLAVTLNAAKEGIPNPGGREEQVNRIRPKKALVVHGAIVIEEMNLVLPLAGNYLRS